MHLLVAALLTLGCSAGSRWTYNVSDSFPSVWFGANTSGSDAPWLGKNDVLK